MNSNRKSLLKTFSWRFLVTVTTFVISWVVTGGAVLGAGIAAIEFWAKLVLYVAHERVWGRFLRQTVSSIHLCPGLGISKNSLR